MLTIEKINTDKIAISISIACVIHCFFMPSFILALPLFFSVQLDNELIHYLMLWLIIPISLFALIKGFINHRNFSFLFIGIIGLFTVISAVLFGESHIGETGERILTLLGSVILSIAHYYNFKTCSSIGCSSH